MGFLKSLVGAERHPPLPGDSYAAKRVENVLAELRQLASETKGRLEIVPAERSAYVFIGKPPKKFGMAWITDGKVTNLGQLAREKNFSPITLEKIEDQLSAAYKRSQSDQRFTCDISGQEIVVTPSQDLEREVHDVIQALLK